MSLSGKKIQLISEALNLLFTEPINCAKNTIFRFEMVAVVLCFAVDSCFIYSVLEIEFCKLMKKIKHTHEFFDRCAKHGISHFDKELSVFEKQTKLGLF